MIQEKGIGVNQDEQYKTLISGSNDTSETTVSYICSVSTMTVNP